MFAVQSQKWMAMNSHAPVPGPPEESSSAEPTDGLPSFEPTAAAPPQREPWLRFLVPLRHRRRFLIDRPVQLRAAFLSGTVALILLVLLNVSLHVARQRDSEALLTDAPEFRALIVSQNRMELGLIALASLVFIGGVVVITVLETHKTAGAAFNLARHMLEVEHGNYDVRLHLRKDDNLQQLEAAFNSMASALRSRTTADAEALEELAGVAERISGPDEAEHLARRLRELAQAMDGLPG